MTERSEGMREQRSGLRLRGRKRSGFADMAVINRAPDSFFDRGAGTMAVLGVSAWPGARVFRVHDAAGARRALDAVAAAQRAADSR